MEGILFREALTLPNINEVIPLNDGDTPVIQEIKEVLRKHNALSRFGLSLLHEHFPIGDDEAMVEIEDLENRMLISKTVKLSELESGSFIQTQWRLDTNAPLMRCNIYCPKAPDGEHLGKIHSS